MPFVDEDACELNLKLVYHGPGLAGKTANMQFAHARIDPAVRSKLTSVATETERFLLFSCLPKSLAPLGGYTIRVHLYTVPGPVFYDESRRKALQGVSGVIFVADSQRLRNDANVESLENLREHLDAHGLHPADVPIVFQYNKRDLPNLLSVDELNRVLNPNGAPHFAATARLGEGVMETLKACTDATYAKVKVNFSRGVYR
jgi:signal recognition particle receptor subunit beta